MAKTKTKRKKYKIKNVDEKIDKATSEWEKAKIKLKELKREKKRLEALRDKHFRREITSIIAEKGYTVKQSIRILKEYGER